MRCKPVDLRLSYVVVMVFLCFISFGGSMTYVILPLYILDINPKAVYAGLLSASGSISMIVSSVLTGYISDRLQKKRLLMMFGALTLIPETILFSYITDVYQIIVLRFFQGISITACRIASQALITQFAKHETMGKSVGWIYAISSIGMAFGTLTGGFTGKIIGYRNTFLVGSLFPFICSILTFFIIEPKVELNEDSEEQVRKGERIRFTFNIFHALLVKILTAAGDIYIFFTVYFRSIGFSSEYIGILKWIQSIGHVPFGPLAGNLCDRFGRKKVLAGGIFTLLIVNFLMTLNTNFFLAAIGMAVISFGWSSFSITSTTILLDYTDATQRSQALGLSSTTMGIAHAMSGTYLGILSDSLSIPVAMRLNTIVVMLSSFIVSLKVKESRKSIARSQKS